MKIQSHSDYPELLKAENSTLQKDKGLYESLSLSNVENYIGTARVPVGIAGPILVNGEHANGTYFIPMATTEGTLVASTSRGMKIINESGGVDVKVVGNGGVQRAPVFEFSTINDTLSFCSAIKNDWQWLKPAVEASTSHGKLIDVSCFQMGRMACVRISMDPGEASGQNMVSVGAQNGVKAIVKKFPSINRYRMAGGLSGEKETSSANALLGRGKSVVCSVNIPGEVMRSITRCNIPDLLRHQQNYSNFASWSGNQSPHNSIANTLVAMYIAAGQDVAAVYESRLANNVIDYNRENDVLSWDLHIPTLTLGTVGGGTGLPCQRECLEIMGCDGAPGSAEKFAELCAVTALSNEISFWGAICADEWIEAHAGLKNR